MASPHVPADMMQPAGMLTKSLFPQFADQSTLNTFLQGLLDEGYLNAAELESQEEKDGAAIAFGYWRAYIAIYQRLLATPSSAAIEGEGSRQFLWSQIEAFKKMGEDYNAQYVAFFDASTEGIGAQEKSSTVINRIVW